MGSSPLAEKDSRWAKQASLYDWRTQRKWIDLVRAVLGRFHDAATSADNPTGADSFWTDEDQAQTQDWTKLSALFCNPPWSRKCSWIPTLAEWSSIWADYAHERPDGQLIAICPASTNAIWWHDNVWEAASAVFFPRGRIVYDPPMGIETKGSPMGDSAIVYYGARILAFEEPFAPYGAIVRLRGL